MGTAAASTSTSRGRPSAATPSGFSVGALSAARLTGSWPTPGTTTGATTAPSRSCAGRTTAASSPTSLPEFHPRKTSAVKYNVGHPLIRDVLFFFLLEVPVTNLGAQ